MPEIMVKASWNSDVGPLQALIDELEFNATVAKNSGPRHYCQFLDDQFRRAISEGAISIIEPGLKEHLLEAYNAMLSANQHMSGFFTQAHNIVKTPELRNDVLACIETAGAKIRDAQKALENFLRSE